MSRPVLVDGSFDPLHPGHLSYFEAAKSFGPLLCRVASDDDIRAKGREPLYPQTIRARMVQALGIPTTIGHSLAGSIGLHKPALLVKGKDWEGRLPADVSVACALRGTQIAYLPTVTDSSTLRLRAWAAADTARQLDALEAYASAQTVCDPDAYDEHYFTADWRGADGYTLENRRRIEGPHPDLIAGLWKGRSVLDVGCGPGYLLTLLHERGMAVRGIEPSAGAVRIAPEAIRPRIWCGAVTEAVAPAEVVICREVLEHLTVPEVTRMVGDLFQLADYAVYITTRFSADTDGLLAVRDERDVDPTHQTLLTQTLLRTLCVLHGGKRDRVAETVLDHGKKGRVLVYTV